MLLFALEYGPHEFTFLSHPGSTSAGGFGKIYSAPRRVYLAGIPSGLDKNAVSNHNNHLAARQVGLLFGQCPWNLYFIDIS